MINNNEDGDENQIDTKKTDHIDTTWIDLGLYMDTNVVNIKSVSVLWCFYVLSNT